ncbi:hypothetical protein NKI25_17690 [Mesorhizobium sp. M0808]|uniref:hypothetical protein n=1 Tax=Mesorhizobium sp. M0808 TaxID=2957002 RepID=UPI003338B968
MKAHQFFTPFSFKTAVAREAAQRILEFFEYLILLSAFYAAYLKTQSTILWACSFVIMVTILFYVISHFPQSILYPSNLRREWILNIALSLGMILLAFFVMIFSVKVIAGLILTAIL